MKYQKITNLLDTTFGNAPRFITKKQIKVHDHSGSAEDRYKLSKQIRLKISMLRSGLCDQSDAYIVAKRDISLTKTEDGGFIDVRNRFLAFKDTVLFTDCNSKINGVLIDNEENFDVVIPMYNSTK